MYCSKSDYAKYWESAKTKLNCVGLFFFPRKSKWMFKATELIPLLLGLEKKKSPKEILGLFFICESGAYGTSGVLIITGIQFIIKISRKSTQLCTSVSISVFFR